MEETTAISPEVQGLFDTVREQAREYSLAFEFLEKEKNYFERQRHELIELTQQLKEQVSDSILELNSSFHDAIDYINDKTDKTIKVYYDLENIRSLRDTLTEFHKILKKDSIELKSNYEKIRAKTDVELETAMSNIKHTIDKELEIEGQKLEVRIALKLKYLESKLQAYDKKLFVLKEAQTREVTKVQQEQFTLKEKDSEILENTEELFVSLKKKIDETEERMMKKMQLFDAAIQDFRFNYIKKDEFESIELTSGLGYDSPSQPPPAPIIQAPPKQEEPEHIKTPEPRIKEPKLEDTHVREVETIDYTERSSGNVNIDINNLKTEFRTLKKDLHYDMNYVKSLVTRLSGEVKKFERKNTIAIVLAEISFIASVLLILYMILF